MCFMFFSFIFPHTLIEDLYSLFVDILGTNTLGTNTLLDLDIDRLGIYDIHFIFSLSHSRGVLCDVIPICGALCRVKIEIFNFRFFAARKKLKFQLNVQYSMEMSHLSMFCIFILLLFCSDISLIQGLRKTSHSIIFLYVIGALIGLPHIIFPSYLYFKPTHFFILMSKVSLRLDLLNSWSV